MFFDAKPNLCLGQSKYFTKPKETELNKKSEFDSWNFRKTIDTL